MRLVAGANEHPERLLVLEGPSHERLIDDDHRRRARSIAPAKPAAADERDPQGFEVARPDDVHEGRRASAGFPPANVEASPHHISRQRDDVGHAHRSHIGQEREAFRQLLGELEAALVRAAAVERDSRDDARAEIEPRIQGRRASRGPHEQRREDEEERRQRHLADHERVAEAQAARASRLPRVVKLRRHVHSRASQSRRQAAGGRRHQRQEEGVPDQPGIGCNRETKWELARQHHRVEDRDHGQRQQHSAGRADEAEHERFCEQRLNQPAALGPERNPHGDLVPPRRRPREEQAGHVAAGDQQHEPEERQDDERQQQHFRRRVPEHLFPEREHGGRLAQAAVLLRIAALELLAQPRHRHLCLLRDVASAKPRDDGEPVRVLTIVETAQEQVADRDVQVRLPDRRHRLVVGRQNADDVDRLAVQVHDSADHCRIAVEPAAPEVVAHHGDARVTLRHLRAGDEGAADVWLHAQRFEEVSGHGRR